LTRQLVTLGQLGEAILHILHVRYLALLTH